MKRVLISGYIGFNNFGDEAIFYTLQEHLKDLGYSVGALCANKKKVAKKYKVRTYNYKNIFEILFAILTCNVLISGGGSLLQNKTSNFSLFYYLFIIILAKLFFKKVIIFAQGIEPVNGIFAKFFTKIILKSLKYVSVRDEKSRKLLKKQNINAHLLSDPVYSLVQNYRINNDKKDLVVQLRHFKGIRRDFLESLAFSISNHFSGNISVFSFQDEIDGKICLNFIDELKKRNKDADFIPSKDIDETINIINKAQYVISMRLHGLIISNALQSNTFALCYDEKIKTLTNELDIPYVDVFNYENENLDNKLDEFFNHRINEVHPYRKFHWDYIDDILENNSRRK